ncbi:prolyl aminopeptidase [Gallaecimonas kandeliae]|uniref:prolyl aminopeptidase n=1 Tax=Gallaecimonas kandeliae TaxID=3029055 RepID=UPI00264901F7|nr:prolyl aminopeptidase [Gallaecimonas kandeliae]WKE65590.1 prolyl aminopeptidase [Gallaecimonas kandeliae]
MRTLLPEITPNWQQWLPVGDGHELYVEEVGNPQGLPVVVLHGGPGAGCNETMRRFFDPARYRVILFDQRGAGRSRPHASLEGNNTQNLVADIELIRANLGIDSWLVFGGSWGSTLALAYAETHPQRVKALVLRGIFLARDEDIHWMTAPDGGSAQVYPDHYRDFLEPLGGEAHDLLARYYALLTSDNELERMQAAKAWTLWEGRMVNLVPPARVDEIYTDPSLALAVGRMECHYFVHRCFLDEDQLLLDAHKLAGIPTVLVHGRYDMVCKLENATSLAAKLPDAQLWIVPAAGHSAMEPGITDGLIKALDWVWEKLK